MPQVSGFAIDFLDAGTAFQRTLPRRDPRLHIVALGGMSVQTMDPLVAEGSL